MNRESQKRKIRRFLGGKGKRDLDAFCIYQWIDRCHYEAWWDLALALRPSIPPNSLGEHYDKRLDYLLRECKNEFDSLTKEYVEVKNPNSQKSFLIPDLFWSTCTELGLKLGGSSNAGIRLDYLRTKIVFVERLNIDGCVLRLYGLNAEALYSWLCSHGFKDLSDKIIWPRKSTQTEKSRLKLSWHDATNLAPSLFEELKEKVPGHKLIKVVISTTWENWEDCVDNIIETLQLDKKEEEKREAKKVLRDYRELQDLIIGCLRDIGRDDLIQRMSVQ
ncbi:MAG TPA: hypothetical protein VMW89_09360 [Desulfatiglandales bacterium]|nr:hypothetical protein [Desulfatiglandales bacterium]